MLGIKRPRRFVAIAVMIVASIIVAVVWRQHSKRGAAPDLLTARVVYGDIEKSVLATGTLEPRALVSVGAQVSGQLQELDVVLGQTVRKGDPIGRIDADPQTNALQTADAALADADAQRAVQQASLTQAQLAFSRQQAMVAGEATSRADYEAAAANLASARAQVAAANARIRSARISVNNARVNLGYTRISAPMDGVVVAVVTKQGQTVNANQTAPTIVILARLDVMTVKAEVSEADVIDLAPGLPVYFTVLGDPRHRYRSTLRQIEPAPESIASRIDASATAQAGPATASAIYYNARFEVPNPDGRLRALMTAQVSIVQAARRHVLTIPSTAIGAQGSNGSAVIQVRDDTGKVVNRRVRIGLNTNVMAEVVSGLSEGEMVVVGDARQRAAKPAMGG